MSGDAVFSDSTAWKSQPAVPEPAESLRSRWERGHRLSPFLGNLLCALEDSVWYDRGWLMPAFLICSVCDSIYSVCLCGYGDKPAPHGSSTA